jgi:hypothetical protein
VFEHKYATDLVMKAKLAYDGKRVVTPMEANVRLRAKDGEKHEDLVLYKQLVGSLIYLTITRPDVTYVVHTVTRPDVTYVVHTVSQFMNALTLVHLTAMLRIIQYMRDTMHFGMFFSTSSSIDVRAYCDSGFEGSTKDHFSIIGFCVFIASSLISWKSKKK